MNLTVEGCGAGIPGASRNSAFPHHSSSYWKIDFSTFA